MNKYCSVYSVFFFWNLYGFSLLKEYQPKCPKNFQKYDYVGCFEDNVFDRILKDLTFNNFAENNVNLCVDSCANNANNTLAGLEFGECYCGQWSDIIGRKVFLGNRQINCPHKCPKNKEECGGLNRVSIYAVKQTTEPLPPPDCFWYPDLQHPVLQGRTEVIIRNTVTLCYQLCKNKKFNFSGVRYNLCYCGNEVIGGKLRNGDPFSCMDFCPGKPQQKCGSIFNMVDVYTVVEVACKGVKPLPSAPQPAPTGVPGPNLTTPPPQPAPTGVPGPNPTTPPPQPAPTGVPGPKPTTPPPQGLPTTGPPTGGPAASSTT